MNKQDKKLISAAAALLLLGGCASLSEDAGFGTVQSLAKERLNQDIKWVRSDGDRQAVEAETQALLGKELGVDDAVRVALLNNAGLQATYQELGIAEANVVQAGRLRNPGFTFARLVREDIIEIERKFLFDVLGLLTMPTRSEIETRRFEQTKLRVTAEVLRVAADTRRAYFSAIAAEQATRYMEDVVLAAEASAELAQRMAAAGNLSKLDQARNQVFHSEAAAQLSRTRQEALAERERLARLMGLSGDDTRFRLPNRLPDLPKAPEDRTDVEQAALARRLDIQAARQEVDGLAKSLGLTRATRFVNVLEASYLRNTTTGEPRKTGYEIEISIPLFDFGEAKVAKAEAVYLQAVQRLAEIAVNARSEVRQAHGAYRTAFDVAKRHRDEIVPLASKIGEENLLRYQGMLISVFELLAEARQQTAAVNAAIQAQRDFWLAETDLQMATSGGAGGMRGVSLSSASLAAGGDAAGGH